MSPCDLFMDALKFSGLPDYAHRYYSQHFSWAFVPIDPVNVPTKFEVHIALPVPEIMWVLKKFGQCLDTHTLHFLQIFNGLLFGLALYMYPPSLKSVALPVPEIRGVAKLQTPQFRGRGGRRGSVMVPFERALVSFYRPSIVTFPLSLRILEILSLLFSSMPLFPYPTSSLPKISPCSPGIRWIVFWLQTILLSYSISSR